MPELPKIFHRRFAPEVWSPLEKLLRFTGPPLPDDSNVRIGLRDCLQHLRKVEVLLGVANQLRLALIDDIKELERLGGTSNANGANFAAVMESAICSLYSAIDGLRTFIFGAYRRVQGVQNGSNGKLFDRARDSEYGVGFPEEIRVLLASANAAWFEALRELRTELTHGSTGSCHFRKAENTVLYMNEGIIRDGKALWIEDFENKFREWHQGATTLVNAIADFHFNRLEPRPSVAYCGLYRGRLYARMVAPNPSLSFNDGHCLSYDWFEKEPEFFCPLAENCGAFARKWPGGSAAIFHVPPSNTEP